MRYILLGVLLLPGFLLQAAPQFSQAECQKLNGQRLEVRKQLRQPYSPEHGQQLQAKLTELEGVLERHCKNPVKNPPKLP